MAIPIVEPIVSHRSSLDELTGEIAAVSRRRLGGRASRALMKRLNDKIADGMGFVLLDGADCIGILLYSADYELRFSSLLSHESAEKLPKSVTVFICYILDRSRDGSNENDKVLLQSAVSRLRTVESIETIAIQPISLYRSDIEKTLSRTGFLICGRVDMEKTLKGPIEISRTPADFQVAPIAERDIDGLRSVVYNGYFSEIDGYLFPDIATVCSEPALFREFMDGASIDRESSVIAKVGGYPAGCILVLAGGNRRRGLIGVVATIPEMRRRGVAKAMLAHALKLLKEHKRDRAALAVTVENRPAYKLYTSLGFKEVAPHRPIAVWRRSVSRPGKGSRW